MDIIVPPRKNSDAKVNQRLALQATIKPHAILRSFASFPDAIVGKARGMALIDKIDELIAEDELMFLTSSVSNTDNLDTKMALNIYTAQMQKILIEERIKKRISKIPKYGEYMDKINEITNQLKYAVERYGFSNKENIAFYRVLKEQVLRKTPPPPQPQK